MKFVAKMKDRQKQSVVQRGIFATYCIRGSAMAEQLHDALVSRNSATTKYP